MIGARGPSLMLAAAALFGTIGTARLLGPDAPAAGVGAVRLGLAAIILVALAQVRGGWVAQLRRGPTLVAGLAQAAFQVTFLGAVVQTGVAVGTLVAIGSAPLLAGLLARQVSRQWLLATGVAVAGLVLLVLGGAGARLSPSGLLLALGAGASYATYVVATARALDDGSAPALVTAVAFGVAAVLLSPALWLTDLAWVGTGSGWLMVGYLALVPTVLAYRLLAGALVLVPPATAQTLALAEPVVATVLGVVVLGERLAPLGWAGAALVLAGLMLVARRAQPAAIGATARHP